MDDQLRRRSVGTPAARSVLLTILGEYVLPLSGSVWQETLIRALGALGASEQAARQALARSTRDGWLTAERRGRRARMSLTPETAELLRRGATRIYAFGEPWEWDGGWLITTLRVPELRRDARHRMRTQLAWAGLGSLGGGLWLTPHLDREPEVVQIAAAEPHAEVLTFRARLGALGEPSAVIRAAWDLDAIAAHYRGFVEAFARARPTTPERCFRIHTEMVHAWRKFPFLDPDLPPPLLPPRWPQRRAHRIFHQQHARWRERARERFLAFEG